MKDIFENAADFNRVGYEFLQTELEAGYTFAKTALQAGDDSDKKERNITNAKKAFNTVHDMIHKVRLNPQQSQSLQNKAQELRSVLKKLGVVV
jgi:hypothetical protein